MASDLLQFACDISCSGVALNRGLSKFKLSNSTRVSRLDAVARRGNSSVKPRLTGINRGRRLLLISLYRNGLSGFNKEPVKIATLCFRRVTHSRGHFVSFIPRVERAVFFFFFSSVRRSLFSIFHFYLGSLTVSRRLARSVTFRVIFVFAQLDLSLFDALLRGDIKGKCIDFVSILFIGF